ncbi:MAG: hypothetical protein LAT84_00555 [Balneolia bacterium]|nr:hypothetical protein [Balneolia bacterium]
MLFLFPFDFLLAQEGEEVIQRNRLTVQNADTRSLALGSSTLADIYFSDAFGINPAIVGFGEHGNYIHGSLNQDWNTNILQATLALPRLEVGRHSIGSRLSAVNRGPAAINIGDAPAFNPTYTLVQASVAYAYRIHEHLSLGTLQYVTYADHLSDSGVSYGADLGLLYAPDGAVTYAIAFRGLGQDPVVLRDEAGERLNYEMMHQVLEIGATLRYPEFEDYHYFSFSLSNEKRFNEDGMWYKAGLEVLPVSFLALRSGLMLQTEDNRLVPRFGIGTSFSILRFDYSIGPNERNNVRFHQFGLSLQL